MKKKILVALLATTTALSMVACGGTKLENTSSDSIADETVSNESEDKESNKPANHEQEGVIIELIAGEQGEYGKQITMNEETDMEETFYVYYVPAGTYTVTNEDEYMTQISVYEGFEKNEETGYDEYTNVGDVLLLDAGKEDVININDGWFVEIQEPTHISLTPVDNE